MIPSRRRFLQSVGMAAAATPLFAQGHCRDGYGRAPCPLTKDVATAPIPSVFAPTGWKTVALDHISYRVANPQKEAAFYAALLGWNPRRADDRQVILDIGAWGSAIFHRVPEGQEPAGVTGFCFVIQPWNAKTVEAELRQRGLEPQPDNDSNGFESFHVKDPDRFDLQIANGNGLAKARKTPPSAKLSAPAPFAPTGWKTIWLDHLSFNAANYKKSASFYSNLLGWKESYDEGSQHELMIGDIGDIIIRGGNPSGREFAPRRQRIDHISFGITPWDTDAVKAGLETRHLRARVDTSTKDDIHVSAYKSYHTTTPNGYDLQISHVTHDTRLSLCNAVKPK